ncbi:MAG TPA: exosortase [Candidatus Competibacter sp.]|nr:exosortase [Candidatus Competibacter sp.]
MHYPILRHNLSFLTIFCCIVAFYLLFHDVIAKLVQDWATDDNYSHGFLIVPISLYLAWERRDRLLRAPLAPSSLGLIVLVGGIVLLVAGVLGAELFVTRIALLAVLTGGILYIFGWIHLRLLAFPLALLLLMIPIPAIIFNQVAFPLQLLASRFAAGVLSLWGIPVLREGNVIMLAHTTLEVAEACSGIRSLMSLVTLGILLGYFTESRSWVRWVLGLVTIPTAILANGLRVAGTGILAHYWGAEVAEGFFHTFSGWLIFGFAFGMVLLIQWLIRVVAPISNRAAKPQRSASEC